MILYHGSSVAVEKPDLVHSRVNVDFGKGFYTTPLYEQALKWCERYSKRGEDGFVSKFEFDESAYSSLSVL